MRRQKYTSVCGPTAKPPVAGDGKEVIVSRIRYRDRPVRNNSKEAKSAIELFPIVGSNPTMRTMNKFETIYGKPRIGKGCSFVGSPNFGSEPYLVTIGDNTTVSFDVAFVTHDAATRVLRNLPGRNKETVIYGPIKIGKNCFIGCRSVILPNVTIGDNVIIGAGSIVNRDIPSNTVAAGVPCKALCTLEEYEKKHKDEFLYMVSLPRDEKKKYLLEHFNLK